MFIKDITEETFGTCLFFSELEHLLLLDASFLCSVSLNFYLKNIKVCAEIPHVLNNSEAMSAAVRIRSCWPCFPWVPFPLVFVCPRLVLCACICVCQLGVASSLHPHLLLIVQSIPQPAAAWRTSLTLHSLPDRSVTSLWPCLDLPALCLLDFFVNPVVPALWVNTLQPCCLPQSCLACLDFVLPAQLHGFLSVYQPPPLLSQPVFSPSPPSPPAQALFFTSYQI